MKLAVLMSHAIQYQVPLLRKLAKREGVDMTAYFCWDYGVKHTFDKEFGKEVRWDIPLLEGYKYKFLKNSSPKPSSDFWGQLNFGIVKELARYRYDAVLLFGWNSFANWLVFLVAPMLGTKIFLHGENPLKQEILKSGMKLRLKKIIFWWLFRRVSAFLYIGEENRKFYLYYGVPESKLFFAPYAVESDRYIAAAKALAPQRDELRKKFGVADRVVILFTGKLIEKKRPMDLLKAFHTLNSKFKLLNSSLIFVGDGVLRGDLEQYVKERHLKGVHFAGFQNQTELPKYYIAADMFVLPSGIGETWGLVVNEAMCFGLPVIVSDMVGCAADLVHEGKNGFTFPLGNIEALAERLKKLAEKKERRVAFGKMSSEIIKGYTQEKDVDAIMAAAKALMG